MAIASDINPQLLKKGIDLLPLDFPEHAGEEYLSALNRFTEEGPELLKGLSTDFASSHPDSFLERAQNLHDLLVKIHAPMLIVHCDNLIQAVQKKDSKVVTTALQLIDAGTSTLFDGIKKLEDPAALGASLSEGANTPADAPTRAQLSAPQEDTSAPAAPGNDTGDAKEINKDNHHTYTEHQLFASLHGLISKRDSARARGLIEILKERAVDDKFRKMLQLIDEDLEKEDIVSAETQAKMLLVALESASFADRADTEFSF